MDGPRIITLIGFMGAGKSAIGAMLARKLDMQFVDLDEVVSREAGKSISEIFAQEGEEGFRERESDALRRELSGGEKVLSCGGGIILRDENVELLRERSRVYLLDISAEKAMERLPSGDGRPLLEEGDREERIKELMAARAERYRSAAHVVIDAESAEAEEDVEEIAAEWSRYGYGRREGSTPST